MVTSRRRKPGQGSIRKRANGTWEARITIDRVSRSYYGRTRREAVEQMEVATTRTGRSSFERFGKRAPFWPKNLDPAEFMRLVNDGLD